MLSFSKIPCTLAYCDRTSISHPWLVPHFRHNPCQCVLCKVIIMESKKSYLCQICGKSYGYSSGLSCHKSTDHPEYSSCNISCNLCVESSRRYVYCYTGILCVLHTCRFYSSNDLIKHYKDVHDQIIKVDKRSFSNFDEFRCGKQILKKTSNSTFFLHSAPNNLADH